MKMDVGFEHTDRTKAAELAARAKYGVVALENLGRDRLRARAFSIADHDLLEAVKAGTQIVGFDRNAHCFLHIDAANLSFAGNEAAPVNTGPQCLAVRSWL